MHICRSLSDSDSDDERTLVSPSRINAIARSALSASAGVTRRRSLRKEQQAKVEEGITTASLIETSAAVVAAPGSPVALAKSLPPRPVGLGAMLHDIKSFKKDNLKHMDEKEAPSAPAVKPQAAPAPGRSIAVVTPARPAAPMPAPSSRGSLLSSLQSVSLRKTGIIREVCKSCIAC